MTTNTDILTLSQLLSPAFPVGGFAYSHGIEAAIENGVIATADTLQAWLLGVLEHGGGRSDAVLLNMAYGGDCAQVDTQARAFATSRERLMETDLQGAAFCDAVEAVWDIPMGRLCYPVAVGHVAKAMGLDPELCTALYLQSFVGNLCAAAMRLVPLGQVDGQKVQTALKPVCAKIGQDSLGANEGQLCSNAWGSDIASMRHETQYSRVFRS